jgi:hypothetical protein
MKSGAVFFWVCSPKRSKSKRMRETRSTYIEKDGFVGCVGR